MPESVKNIVVLTGAGISAESGIPTFRDAGGLWEKYDVYELASIAGWTKDPKTVLDFYNHRRNKVRKAQPNEAHRALVRLENKYHVQVITQNIDNLHERAGSAKVLHLHGEIMKAQSTFDDSLIYDLGDKDIQWGDKCEKGSQLRPYVVWFGELVPMMTEATELAAKANIFIVIGTSMVVYPAAGLINHVPDEAEKYIIDKKIPQVGYYRNLTIVEDSAVNGVPVVVSKLLN